MEWQRTTQSINRMNIPNGHFPSINEQGPGNNQQQQAQKTSSSVLRIKPSTDAWIIKLDCSDETGRMARKIEFEVFRLPFLMKNGLL